MTTVRPENLKKAYRKKRDPRVKIRMVAVNMLCMNDESIRYAADSLMQDLTGLHKQTGIIRYSSETAWKRTVPYNDENKKDIRKLHEENWCLLDAGGDPV